MRSRQFSREVLEPSLEKAQGDGHAKVRPLKLRPPRAIRRGQRTMPQASGIRTANGRPTMPTVTWDHVHLRSPDPEATAAWLADILGGEIIRGPGRIDVKLGGANVFIAPVTAGAGGHTPPGTPHPGAGPFR